MTGGGGSKTVQTTTQELAPEQRRLLEPVLPIAESFVNNPPKMYQGSAIAGFTPLQQQAQQMTLGAANSMLPYTGGLTQRLQGQQQGTAATAQQAGQIGANVGGAVNQNIGQIGQQAQQGQQQLTNIMGGMAGAGGQTQANIGQAIQQGTQSLAPGLGFFTGGNVLNPANNPALQAATEAAIRPIIQNFERSVLPSITQDAIASGGFGGTRQGIAEGLAAEAMMRQVGDTAATLQNQAYGQNLQGMLQGLGIGQQQNATNLQTMLGAGNLQNDMFGRLIQGSLGGQQAQQGASELQQRGILGGTQAQLGANEQQQQAMSQLLQSLVAGGDILKQTAMPGTLTEAVGQQQQAMQQQQLSEQVQRYVNEQMLPFAIAQDVAAMAFGIPAGTTQSTATTTGGGDGGMAAMQMIGGGLSLLPMLFGLFSDRSIKEDIVLLHTLSDGLGVYEYNYRGQDSRHIGLMADEVEELYPWAVGEIEGIKTVRYDLVPTWASGVKEKADAR